MQIDKRITYEYNGFTYTNFVNLSRGQLVMIYDWRMHPSVVRFMNNRSSFTLESHLLFAEKLKEREDVFYWLVENNGKPLGVLNIVDINNSENSCEPGIIFSPDLIKTGISLFVVNNYKAFLFDILGFDVLYGHNYLDNLTAVQYTFFLGAKMIAVEEKDEMRSVKSFLTPQLFKRYEKKELVSEYVRYIRNWNDSDIKHILYDE